MKYLARFKEPSTWAGVAVLAQLAAQVFDIHGDVAGAVTKVCAAVAAVAAVVRAEQTAK
jgi:hypothetical protein